MARTTKAEVLALFQDSEFRQRKREIQKIQKDISKARGIIADGKKRYIKQRLRLRSKKAVEDPFADLTDYDSREDIHTAYGYEFISETEMDRLMILWDTREASLSTAGKYEDRVTLMLEKALGIVGEEFKEKLWEFEKLERKMEADAERIAQENRQREWEREHRQFEEEACV